MNPHATRAAEIEMAFLAGAETNLNHAKGTQLRGSRWSWRTRAQEDRIRELMASRRLYDRDLLRALPKNTARVLTGTLPRFFFGQRRSCVAIASVLSPVEEMLTDDGQPRPVGLARLMAHVKELVGDAAVPHTVGVCSPTGFTEDAKRGGIELPNVTLVLVEPRGDGGWTVLPASPNAAPAECKLFDPEAVANKIKRVRDEVGTLSADLLTGGLSASAIARRMDLPAKVVSAAFEQIVVSDSELKLSRQREDVLLYRGAPAGAEEDDMSMVDWVRQLFSREGNEARKINALSERRVKLVQRRDRLYADIGQLEGRESDLLKQGRDTTSPAVKRRVASQIKQLRDDMDRLNSTAKMLGQQVEVISTHIHNLTLIQQGQIAKLPPTEEITEDAVRAEEMLEQLGSDVQLTSSLSVGVSAALTTDEELAILKELDSPAREEAKPQRESAAKATPEQATAPQRKREPEAG